MPRFLEQQWKDWWTVNDYMEQGKLVTLKGAREEKSDKHKKHSQ